MEDLANVSVETTKPILDKKRFITILVLLTLIILLVRIGYLWGQQSMQRKEPNQQLSQKSQLPPIITHQIARLLPTPTLICLGPNCTMPPSPLPTQMLPTPPPEAESADVQGTLTQFKPDDLLEKKVNALFGWTASSGPVTWYNAGQFTTGSLAGYTRYILVTANIGTDQWDQGCGHTLIATNGNTFYKLASLGHQLIISDNQQYSFLYQSLANTSNTGDICTLQTDMTGFQTISSPLLEFKAYNFPDNANSYIATSNQVLFVDAVGIPFIYTYDSARHLGQPNTIASTLNLFNINTLAGVYENYQIGPITNFGEGDTSELINNFNQTIFKRLTDQNLHQIGTADGGLPVFSFINSSDPALQQIYSNAVNGCTTTPIPAFTTYVEKPPLLLIKDPWNRYLIFEETTFHQMCGGGKPVIYLYPKNAEEVKVSFVKPMHLAVQIPLYHDSWDVIAHPDGSLTDLFPQFTDCQKLDGNRLGSEYAPSACIKNSYPYLYWEGNVKNLSFPMLKNGWIVARESLKAFLQEKLGAMGLTQSEISDMTSYWAPVLYKQKVPYYHLAFLQTDELNQLVPMQVIPHPDTMIRVFLDWQPLQTEPKDMIPPEQLTHTDRHGFTYVEWGGMQSE